jgi:hypothetical protein
MTKISYISSENVLGAENQQGRPQVLEEPSETIRQTPRVTEAYLLGALHDGTFNIGRKTHRFSQANLEWLEILQSKLAQLDYRSWIYREGKNRTVYVLETTAGFLSVNFDPVKLITVEEKIAYIRGFFDAEGGLPHKPSARFYIQLVQKNQSKLEWIRSVLEDLGISCGVVHIPSRKVDPNYFRFFIATKSHKEFSTVIRSEHPRKLRIFESRMKIESTPYSDIWNK